MTTSDERERETKGGGNHTNKQHSSLSSTLDATSHPPYYSIIPFANISNINSSNIKQIRVSAILYNQEVPIKDELCRYLQIPYSIRIPPYYRKLCQKKTSTHIPVSAPPYNEEAAFLTNHMRLARRQIPISPPPLQF